MTVTTEEIPAIPNVPECLWGTVACLKQQLAQIAELFIFELNDKVTRNHLENMIKTWMSFQFKTGRCYDYVVRCDVINNRPETINKNQCIVDIAVKFRYKMEAGEAVLVSTEKMDSETKETPFIFIPLTIKNANDV